MPALTHNRVKNGFNGPIRKIQARNSCPKGGAETKLGCNKSDVERRNARVGGVGPRNASNRAAIKRRVCIIPKNDGKKHCN